jgi:hypothetical protein
MIATQLICVSATATFIGQLNDIMQKDNPEPKPSRLSGLKPTVFIGITVLLSAIILESLSSLFLFRYYSAAELAFNPIGSATVLLAKKALNIPPFHVAESVESGPLYEIDDELGYTTSPGRHTVALSVGSKTYRFSVSVPARGLRATAYGQEDRSKAIYIFGDSFIFGWGNNDEQTMPWLLQEKFPQYQVMNLAQSGYGITQAVIQFRRMKDSVKKDDILILPYADYYLTRNYGPPSFMRGAFSACSICAGRAAKWPVARSNGGELAIEYLNMDCSKNGGYCKQDDPGQAVMVEATQKIIAFFSKVGAKVVLAYLSGPDRDPVIAFARQLGMRVIDIRLDSRSPEWDDFGRFDRHPGPIAQYNYFKKLSSGLEEEKLIETTERPD